MEIIGFVLVLIVAVLLIALRTHNRGNIRKAADLIMPEYLERIQRYPQEDHEGWAYDQALSFARTITKRRTNAAPNLSETGFAINVMKEINRRLQKR